MVAVLINNVQNANKPIQKDIMKNRTETDKYWVYLFLVILVVWLGACGYLCCIKDDLAFVGNRGCASAGQNETTDKGDFIAKSIFNLVRLDEHTKERGPIVVYLNLLLYFILLVVATFAIFLRVYHKYCGHCFFICMGMQIVSISYRLAIYCNYDASWSIVPWEDEFLGWNEPGAIALLICVALLIVVAKRKGKDVMDDAITRTIRFYRIHMKSLLFGLLILAMMGSLICFTFVTIKGVGVKNITLALPMTILVGSSYLMLILYYFGVAVISLTTANNYWTKNGSEVSVGDVSRSIVLICKYHIGTICFNATGILPLAIALGALLKSICHTIGTKSSFANKYIMVAFFFFVAEYSTLITAISGKNFKDATDRFIHLPIEARRVAKNLRENQMIWMIMGLITISVNNLMLIFNWMFYVDDPYFTQTAIFSYATIIYLFMPIALIVDAVMDTILLCDVEKIEDINNASKGTAVEFPTDLEIAQ